MNLLCLVVAAAALVGSASASCNQNATSCGDCLGSFLSCQWCDETSECSSYSMTGCSSCSQSQCFQASCNLNRRDTLIIVPTVIVAGVLGIALWIYCCCCRKSKGINLLSKKESKKDRAERQALLDRQAVRREENNAKADEYRAKYGLPRRTTPRDDDDLLDV
eukprot:m.118703 g.118703  ORF g.118703 m.118703 type:complete len:163 (-) comp52018_c0_seq2:77-565(-)